MANTSFKFNDTVNIVEFGKFNKSGDYIISAKSQYLVDLLTRALQLTCGTSFEFSREYKCDLITYTAMEAVEMTFVDGRGNTKTLLTKERVADNKGNTIGDNPILNALTLANVLLEDRQLVYFSNKLNQPTIKVISSLHKNETIYVRSKDCIVKSVGVNPIDDSPINVPKKKGHRLIDDDDKKEILKIFELVNLERYLKPLVSGNKKEKVA